MKRYVAMLMALLTAAALVLSGCGKDTVSSSTLDEGSSEVSSTVTENSDELSESEEESESEVSSETSTSEVTSDAVSSETSKVESEQTSSSVSSSVSSSTSKPQTSSSEANKKPSTSSKTESTSSETSSKEPVSSEETSSEETTKSCSDIMNAAISGIELPAMTFYDPSFEDGSLKEYFYTELDLSDVSDYSVGVPMMIVHASEIAVFQPKSKAEAGKVKAAIEARLQVLYDTWDTYLPEQFALVEDYQLVEKNGYILFVVAYEADQIVKQFINAVK